MARRARDPPPPVRRHRRRPGRDPAPELEPGRFPGGATARTAAIVVGAVLIAAGLALFVATVRLFAAAGRGTLAPWDPPRRLVVRGPYRHLRHPMISGVALVLAGQALALWSDPIAIWLGLFVAVNAVYLPLVEEPALRRRFGPEHDRYAANVGRWLPRLRPWEPDDDDQEADDEERLQK